MARFNEIAARYDASSHQLILRWLLSHERTVVLVKTATDSHLQSNALAADIALSQEDIQAIDSLFEQRVFEIDPDEITVSRNDGYAHESLDEARRNVADLIPSPQVVADNFSSGYMLQPVGLREIPDGKGGNSYSLADNERLYWGWRLANSDGAPIPVYVKHVAT